ncbi:alpha/beta hydrolase [Bradyrhizobium prioriisuperbiae]|uniref:alpha/beta hydrolase n=1 Tax=Bradyrhizobium prioriisuperbiae TaxID=2854389 RepID=UPI0028E496CE|nr:alpha/beta hydrolase [Bradyrhizobium prioritasuperba]
MTPRRVLNRRTLLAAAAAVTASPALADACRIGPAPHDKGPLVWMDLDQVELDAAYDQTFYSPLQSEIVKRLASSSELVRGRLGPPQRDSYGPTAVEKLDIYRTPRAAKAPVFVMIHGGAWLTGEAKNYAYPAELFVNAGTHYIALDFIDVRAAGGDLRIMVDQVRRGIAWAYRNAARYGGDPERFYIGGHSSGGHLCGLALVTDWQKDFALPPDFIKGGLCMSGLYDMKPVRLSKRSSYVKFDDASERDLSAQRQLEMLRAPVVVTYGTHETPEFQRQNRDFAAALKTVGKPVELVEAPHTNHFEMVESLSNPYGPNGRAALAMMKLSAP